MKKSHSLSQIVHEIKVKVCSGMQHMTRPSVIYPHEVQELVGSTGRNPVDDGHGVVDAEHEEKRAAEHYGRQQDVTDPGPAVHLLVVAPRGVAGYARGERVQHYECCVQAPTIVGVEDPHAGQPKNEDRQRHKLHTCEIMG